RWSTALDTCEPDADELFGPCSPTVATRMRWYTRSDDEETIRAGDRARRRERTRRGGGLSHHVRVEGNASSLPRARRHISGTDPGERRVRPRRRRAAQPRRGPEFRDGRVALGDGASDRFRHPGSDARLRLHAHISLGRSSRNPARNPASRLIPAPPTSNRSPFNLGEQGCMSARVSSSVLIGAFAFSICGVTANRASAQASKPAQPHDMQHMHMGEDQDMVMPSTREGSGTSWLPDETPVYAVHRQAGTWMLMAMGNAFLQYLHDGGDRGSNQGGSVNWLMGMADRTVGSGHLGLRGMISLEPWTIRGCGYPDLLASGEFCQSEA